MKAKLRLLVMAVVVLCLGGCVRGCTSTRAPIHPNPNMDNQPKLKAQQANAFFYDGANMRQPVEGTIARGTNLDQTVETGQDAAGEWLTEIPMAVDAAVLERGHERYQIYCTPCHGENGKGKGVLFERAQIEAANLLEDRLIEQPVGQFYDVITNGLGLMQGYRYPIPTEDRWAITAYVRQEMQQ